MPAYRACQFVSLAMAEQFLQKAAPPFEWHLTAEQFQIALERSVAKRFSRHAPAEHAQEIDMEAVKKYLDSLHIADLALACACSAGNPDAWDYFVARYRAGLERAARAICGEAQSRDLEGSLIGDLYGLRDSGEFKTPLFEYFHGRSKLSTWLYALLAQRHVDRLRRTRRLESLAYDARDGSPVVPGQADSFVAPPDAEHWNYLAILQAALVKALQALDPRDRLRLAYYYADDLTLAQIGKLLGEHEATVSRKLERTRAGIRNRVERILREERGMTDAQAHMCFEYACQQWPFDLTRVLSGRGIGGG